MYDLLNPSNNALRVREHKAFGPYVENLTKLALADHTGLQRLIADGSTVGGQCTI